MPYLSTNFGLLEPEASDYETSRVAVLPVPFERTVSYGKGTSACPAAIIPLSPTGAVTVKANTAGALDFTLDVVGYFE